MGLSPNTINHQGEEKMCPCTSSEVVKKVHESVLNSPLPARTLAHAVGKKYSTLLREINPYDSRAKLGVETFMDILRITGDITPLEEMVKELGYSLRSQA